MSTSDKGGEDKLYANDIAIISEVYNGSNAHASFARELEHSLEDRIHTIVIEPRQLGEDTARWIMVGNLLHKFAVLSSSACLATALLLPRGARYRDLVTVPLALTGVLAAGVYTASWQFDPCCKYQVESDAGRLRRLPLHSLRSLSPVVLIRVDDGARKTLHTVLAGAAASYAVWRLADLFL